MRFLYLLFVSSLGLVRSNTNERFLALRRVQDSSSVSESSSKAPNLPTSDHSELRSGYGSYLPQPLSRSPSHPASSSTSAGAISATACATPSGTARPKCSHPEPSQWLSAVVSEASSTCRIFPGEYEWERCDAVAAVCVAIPRKCYGYQRWKYEW